MCTRCRKVFQDGIDLLQGCPACGWKKFQFMKAGQRAGLASREIRATEVVVERPVITSAMGVRRPPRVEVKGELERDRSLDGYRGRANEGDSGRADDGYSNRSMDGDLAKTEEVDDVELESIRIEEPGSYELNLDTLFNRDELVMALKEGTYVIDLSTAFRKSRKE